tara:strand:+ start:27002 stop:27184 length:183 start_codon:yes stop_codon:yes gene_type:complete
MDFVEAVLAQASGKLDFERATSVIQKGVAVLLPTFIGKDFICNVFLKWDPNYKFSSSKPM